jgi:hypothetical protein
MIRNCDLPILLSFNSGLSGRARSGVLLVDTDFLFPAYWVTIRVVFSDFDVLFKAAGRCGLGRCVTSLVTLPSAVRAGKIDLLV